MVIKVYVSGISGNKEVKKRQQRVLLILDSKNIKYDVIDIAEPDAEEQKDFMQNNSTSNGATISDPNPRHPLPPQIFNEEEYCGDYDQFDMANEIDEMEKFLKLQVSDTADAVISNAEIKLKNGDVSHEGSPAKEEEKETKQEAEKEENEVPAENEIVEAEEKTKEEAKENEDSKEETKEDDEPKETDENEEAKEDVESKSEQVPESGAGDEKTENGKEEEKSDIKENSPEKSKENSPEKSKESSPEKAEE